MVDETTGPRHRLTPDELAKSHHGLCPVSIGDGDCACLVHWVEALQNEADDLRGSLKWAIMSIDGYFGRTEKSGVTYAYGAEAEYQKARKLLDRTKESDKTDADLKTRIRELIKAHPEYNVLDFGTHLDISLRRAVRLVSELEAEGAITVKRTLE